MPNIYIYRLSKGDYFLPSNFKNLDFDRDAHKVILPEVPYRDLRL